MRYLSFARTIRTHATAPEEREAYLQQPAVGMQHHLPLRQLIHESTGRGFGSVKRVYVVPGERTD